MTWGAGQMKLTLHDHPFAAYCWEALVALFERDMPFERRFVGSEANSRRAPMMPASAALQF